MELRAILILSLTAAHNWMFFVVCSLLSIYIFNSVVMAGYDFDWSARIITRVSFKLCQQRYFFIKKNFSSFSPVTVFFSSSIKPFTQQPYPIQPAVTTAISSETLPDYKTFSALKNIEYHTEMHFITCFSHFYINFLIR